MNMDDPWGSPWAQHPSPEATVAKTVFNERHREILTAPPIALETSPWANDDEISQDDLGGWSGTRIGRKVDTRLIKTQDLRQQDAFGDGWDFHAIGEKEVASVGELKKFSTSWDEPTAHGINSSGRIAPSPVFPPAKISRQHSLDPWAAERLSNLEHVVYKAEKLHEPGISDDEHRAVSEVVAQTLSSSDDVAVSVRNEQLVENHKGIEESIPPRTEIKNLGTDARQQSSGRKHLAETQDGKFNDILGTAAGSSRPSSSISDNSRRDEIFHESPTKLLNEESRRSQSADSTPSNVAELINYFDCRAKCEAAVPYSTRQLPTSDDNPVNDGNDDHQCEPDHDDEFGEFEEGDLETGYGTVGANIPAAENPISSKSTNITTVLPADAAPVQFMVDLAALGKLFPCTDQEQLPQDIFVPDTIPYDSFLSADERKLWYRISRYGSMRKHNSGDHDFHARVNWQKSSVRAEILKIVGRWKEEDRVSGRVALGGGSKASSVFGWNDKQVAAIPFSAAFAIGQYFTDIKTPLPEPEIPRAWPTSTQSGRGQKAAQATISKPDPEILKERPSGLIRDLPTSRSSPKRTSQSKSRRRSSAKSARASCEIKPVPSMPITSVAWSSGPDVPSTTISMEDISRISELGLQAEFSRPSLPIDHNASGKRSPGQLTRERLSSSGTAGTPGLIAMNNNGVLEDSGAMELPPPKYSSDTPKDVLTFPILEPAADDDDWGELVSSPTVVSGPAHLNSPNKHGPTHVGDGFAFASEAEAALSQLSLSHSVEAVSHIQTSLSSKTAMPHAAQASVFSTENSIDPWASADFSFFDGASTPTSRERKAIPSAVPLAAKNPDPAGVMPMHALSSLLSKEQLKVEKVVETVLESLPDLSYMLR